MISEGVWYHSIARLVSGKAESRVTFFPQNLEVPKIIPIFAHETDYEGNQMKSQTERLSRNILM